MRAWLTLLLLLAWCLGASAAVIPDAKLAPRDQGAPALPGANAGEPPPTPTAGGAATPGPGPRPPKPAATSRPPAPPATSGPGAASGGVSGPNEGLPPVDEDGGSRLLQPVANQYQGGVPWHLVLVGVGMLVAMVVLASLLGRNREGPE